MLSNRRDISHTPRRTHLKKGTALLLIAGILLFGSVWHFFIRAEGSVREPLSQSLTQTAEQGASLFHTKISSSLQFIASLSVFLGSIDDLTGPVAQDMLRAAAEKSDFVRLAVITPDGTSRTSDDREVSITGRKAFEQVMSGKSVVSEVFKSRLTGNPVFVLAAPIVVDGIVIGAVCGTYETETFSELLGTRLFDGQGDLYVVRPNGECLVAPASNPRVAVGESLFDFLERNALSSTEMAQLRNNMAVGKNGTLFYTSGDREEFISYVSSGVRDWYVLSVAPTNVAVEQVAFIKQLALFLAIQITAVCVLLGAYVVFTQRNALRLIRTQNTKLETLARNIPGAVLLISCDEHCIVEASDGFYTIFGCTDRQSCGIGTVYDNIVYPGDRLRFSFFLEDLLVSGKSAAVEYRIIREDGEVIWVLDNTQRFEESGKQLFCCVLIDITEHKRAEEKRFFDAERYRLLFELTDTMMFEFDFEGKLLNSTSLVKKFGVLPEEGDFPQCQIDAGVVHPDDVETFTSMIDLIFSGERESESVYRMRSKSGSYLWCEAHLIAMYDEHNVCRHVLGKVVDVDARERELATLKSAVSIDAFTGLHNKASTERLIQNCTNDPAMNGLLCILDIDNFKSINDVYGHAFGDIVILAVAQTMQRTFRSSDILGRIGGDEFAIFVRDVSMASADSVDFSRLCRIAVEGDGIEIEASCSAGVALFPRDGETFSQLYRRADLALYQSKRRGKGRCTIFEPGVVSE